MSSFEAIKIRKICEKFYVRFMVHFNVLICVGAAVEFNGRELVKLLNSFGGLWVSGRIKSLAVPMTRLRVGRLFVISDAFRQNKP